MARAGGSAIGRGATCRPTEVEYRRPGTGLRGASVGAGRVDRDIGVTMEDKRSLGKPDANGWGANLSAQEMSAQRRLIGLRAKSWRMSF